MLSRVNINALQLLAQFEFKLKKQYMNVCPYFFLNYMYKWWLICINVVCDHSVLLILSNNITSGSRAILLVVVVIVVILQLLREKEERLLCCRKL